VPRNVIRLRAPAAPCAWTAGRPGPFDLAQQGVVALAALGTVEGLVIHLAGNVPHDEVLAERAVLGVLGLPSSV
jgi:hypothetical protein